MTLPSFYDEIGSVQLVCNKTSCPNSIDRNCCYTNIVLFMSGLKMCEYDSPIIEENGVYLEGKFDNRLSALFERREESGEDTLEGGLFGNF